MSLITQLLFRKIGLLPPSCKFNSHFNVFFLLLKLAPIVCNPCTICEVQQTKSQLKFYTLPFLTKGQKLKAFVSVCLKLSFYFTVTINFFYFTKPLCKTFTSNYLLYILFYLNNIFHFFFLIISHLPHGPSHLNTL